MDYVDEGRGDLRRSRRRFGAVLRGCGDAVASIRRAAEEVVRRVLGSAWKT